MDDDEQGATGLAEGGRRGLTVEVIDAWSPRAAQTWRRLALESPSSYFLSWGWVENWLAMVPAGTKLRLAVFDDGASACFLGFRLGLHHRAIPSQSLHVNATGIARLDEVWIEHNGLVGRDLPLDAFVRALPARWDEVVLPGVTTSAFGGFFASPDAALAGHRVVRRDVPDYHVRLDRVRETSGGYLSLLSSQTRAQIRRAQREAGAELDVTVARTLPEAIDIYSELVELHTRSWRNKGESGAFADAWFDRLHRRLVAKRFPHGEIQLVRVRGAHGTIGCLYNFVWQGRVLQYQTGLARYDDPHQKPGFVCHAAAIEHAARDGLAVYDFLGGDMRYKHSLSTDRDTLVWATVQRPRLRFAVERRLIAAWRARSEGAR